MARIAVKTTIASTPDVIFDKWSDGRRFPEWKPTSALRVELLTAEPVGLHSRFRGTYKGLGELEWEIVEYERPHRVTTLAHTRFGDLRHTIVLEPDTGGTRVTQTGETRPTGIMRLLSPVMTSNIRKGFYADTHLLEKHLGATVTTR